MTRINSKCPLYSSRMFFFCSSFIWGHNEERFEVLRQNVEDVGRWTPEKNGIEQKSDVGEV